MATEKTPDFLKQGEGFVDITLSRPLDVSGAKTSKVRMREPLVRDQRAMSKGAGSDEEKEIGLMANLCDLSPEDIDAMPLKDYKRMQVALMGFIG